MNLLVALVDEDDLVLVAQIGGAAAASDNIPATAAHSRAVSPAIRIRTNTGLTPAPRGKT